MLRLLCASDLHGNLALYEAAAKAALRRGADALVFAGDLCPGTPSASSTHLPQAHPEFIRRDLSPLLEEWKRVHPGLRVFAIPGNDDCQTILPALSELEQQGLVHNLHGRIAKLADYTLMGIAFVPPTPFSIKDFERRDCEGKVRMQFPHSRCVLSTTHGFQTLEDFEAYLDAQPTIEQELSKLPEADPRYTILVAHCPPHGTDCDVLHNGQHIGSEAIRRWIEQRQPILTLHGHIHESPRISGACADRIGRTTVVNPGCDGHRPHWVLIELEDPIKLDHSIFGREIVRSER